VTIPVLFVLVLVGVVLALALGLGHRGVTAPHPGTAPRLDEVRRTTRRWRVVGGVAGLAAAAFTAAFGPPLGLGIALAGPVFAVCLLAGVLAGELAVTAPTTSTRRASLEVRRVRDYLPRRLARAVAAVTVLLGALLVAGTLLGSPDDLGRAGRSLARSCGPDSSAAVGPWPGSFYTVPISVVVGLGVAAAAVALARIVRRPRQGEDVPADDALRAQAATAITAATGILVAVPAAGIALVASAALVGFPCPAPWFTVVGLVLLALSPALLVFVGWCATRLVAPTRARMPVRSLR
jgi:hypothetical protein